MFAFRDPARTGAVNVKSVVLFDALISWAFCLEEGVITGQLPFPKKQMVTRVALCLSLSLSGSYCD